MSKIYKLTNDELFAMNDILIKKTNLPDLSPCFCGSNDKFISCCKSKPNSWSAQTNFIEELVKFRQSKKWTPVSDRDILFLLSKFQKFYLESLDICSRPGCINKPTVASHVYGKKHIKKYLLNDQCKIYNSYSGNFNQFETVDTGKQITYRIFCNTCEQLFKEIDDPNHNILDDCNRFLHLLRTQSYQYQVTRFNLAFAHQFTMWIQLVLRTEERGATDESSTILDLNWLVMENTRYQYQEILRKSLWDQFNGNEKIITIPYVHTRCLSVKEVFFASGIYNPSHDIEYKEVTFKKDASIFYYILPRDSKNICVTIASFDKEYQEMINQLSVSSDYNFKKYTNHLISFCNLPLNLILPDSYNIKDNIIKKIKTKRALARQSNPKKPNDLDSRKVFANFII